tara:strand:+ start:81 stop:398 length:318 start_codon:yes stop_codon:yes gene_type:complete
MGLVQWKIMFDRRKIFLRGAAVFGFILSPFFCAAQEYRLRIGVVADGSHELSWDSADREAKYTVEYASDLAKPQWTQLSVGSAWPIDTSRYKLPLVLGAKTVFIV